MTAPDPTTARALFLNGTVGAGKTTTAEAVGALLQERGTPHAIIDLDALRRVWPSPADDPFFQQLELANLTAVAGNALRAGAERLVLAGVMETATDRDRYTEALGVRLTVCRLVVPLPRVRSRLLARHPPGEERDWHLARLGELHAILQAARVDDVTVTVDDQPPAGVAGEVLRTVGWV